MLILKGNVYEFEPSAIRHIGPRTVLVKRGSVEKAKQKGTGRARKR